MHAKKANANIGCINMSLVFKSCEALVPLYPALVRPLLEYCVQLCTPHFKKYVVYRTTGTGSEERTRIVRGLEAKPYEKRPCHI